MREMTVREANQNVSQVIAAAERGETIVITKNGIPVAKIAPQTADRGSHLRPHGQGYLPLQDDRIRSSSAAGSAGKPMCGHTP
jgi:prevent-host-death family protein